MLEGKDTKVLVVVGARPNFMKAGPIIHRIREHNQARRTPRFHHVLLHTGQHYDASMSDRFFVDLSLPTPDIHLGVGSGSQAVQTAQILERFENVLSQEIPDIVIVVGDVNSTLACALALAKWTPSLKAVRPLLVHVEAGLRSFDRAMPEEINRIVTDHLADLLFVTEESGLANLKREGIPDNKIHFVGNTMIDSLLASQALADESLILAELGLHDPSDTRRRPAVRPYALLTLHRPSNVDEPTAFREILEALQILSEQMEIVFPVHPRTRKRISEFAFDRFFQPRRRADGKGICLIDPLGYLDFLSLMKNARLVLTDSGGVQEETTCLGIPCVTLRENTERPVTVTHGTNIIAGTKANDICKAITKQLTRPVMTRMPEKWDGKAAERLVETLARTMQGDELSRAEAASNGGQASDGRSA